MNCKEAKKIQIVDFLHNHGIKPEGTYAKGIWYKAPYREDKNASLKINPQKNTWYDLSTGNGGTIIDLVILMFNTDLTGALSKLENLEPGKTSFSFSTQQKETSGGIKINHVQPLQNRALVQYLEERKINLKTAANFVTEAYYTAKNRNYFALAFKNDKGGYELRNRIIKNSSSPKYITTISGSYSSIDIFEGFMNFLSALTLYNTQAPENFTIVLNGTGNLPYAEKYIKSASKINSFLDNDSAGNKALNLIRELNPNVINQAVKIYPGFNDFNDFICNKPLP